MLLRARAAQVEISVAVVRTEADVIVVAAMVADAKAGQDVMAAVAQAEVVVITAVEAGN
jgi:hypothetical protein